MSYLANSFDKKIVELLRSGAVGFMPSDTIYGLSCRAMDRRAVRRLHTIKNRDKSKPFIVLISRTEQLEDLGVISSDAGHVFSYWPGKLTVICQSRSTPDWLHMGTNSLAVRQPDYPELLDLISEVGPIISTSANLAGDKPAESVADAQEYFGDKLDFYVDAGDLVGQSSTIVKPVFDKLEIIRQGAVKIKKEDLA